MKQFRFMITPRWALIPALSFAAMTAGVSSAQPAPADDSTPAEAEKAAPANETDKPASAPAADEPISLNPFEVSTGKDKGYKATNVTSGTRLDTQIQKLPMPIEVITEDFIRDTGSTNLRSSLSYSAGVQIQNQNDYGNYGSGGFQNPGGVNNPTGKTADKSDSNFVMRGFLTENVLRDGFRRRVTTDAVDISRIEVIRGPAALLYGTGNFGGVINYIPKRPESSERQWVEFTAGSNEYFRFTADSTGPLLVDPTNKDMLLYRVNLAAQSNGDHTEYFKDKKLFVAPVFVMRPWENTELIVDTQVGREKREGIGFQSLRARADIAAGEVNPGDTGNQARFERAVFIRFPGKSLREMRWSGPDTEQDIRAQNVEFKLNQKLAEGLFLQAGFNSSLVSFDTRDISANATNGVGPTALWSTLDPQPLNPGVGDTEAGGWYLKPVENAIVQYRWADTYETTRSNQSRVELNYVLEIGENRRWLRVKNNFLAGFSSQQDKNLRTFRSLDRDETNTAVWNYKSVNDSSPFRFGVQGDGTPDNPIRQLSKSQSKPHNRALYGIYYGEFLDGKLTLLGGIREDRSRVNTRNTTFSYATGAMERDDITASPESRIETKQLGISIEPIKGLSFYAMTAEGFEPDFNGDRDLSGRALEGVTAKNKEYGVKFEILGGRVSGTISHYDIEREGVPNGSLWWAPQTANLGGPRRFDPTKPTVYKVSRENPDAAQSIRTQDGRLIIDYNNNWAWYGDLSKLAAAPEGHAMFNGAAGFEDYQNDGLNAEREKIVSTWNAAKAAGAVKYYNRDATAQISAAEFAAAWGTVRNSDDNPAWAMINASTPEGAAYMDAVYGYSRQVGIVHPGIDNFAAWFFGDAPASTGYNSATMDTNGNATSGLRSLVATASDSNEGWDGQLIITPVDEWQILFSFTKNEHKISTLGQLPKYPYQDKDRWAPWMFPNSGFGLQGYYGQNEQYADESDTSTYTWAGYIYPGVQGSDYPKKTWSVFTNYKFDRIPALKGLTLGGGLKWQGQREYASGYTHGGGRIKGDGGTPVVLYTDEQKTVDMFARYEFKWKKRPVYVQLNVDNVLDDQGLYGYLYAPGRSMYFRLGAEF